MGGGGVSTRVSAQGLWGIRKCREDMLPHDTVYQRLSGMMVAQQSTDWSPGLHDPRNCNHTGPSTSGPGSPGRVL